jgi:ubiquinone/menaquinone biosynthesis C-methylase UbiE
MGSLDTTKPNPAEEAGPGSEDLELEGLQRLGFARGNRKIIEFLEHELGSMNRFQVLDLGCGYGGISLALAQRANRVVSVDRKLEPELAHLSNWARERSVKNVNIVNASALELPLESQSFDLLTVNGMLEWVGHANPHQPTEKLQRQALSEMARVLRPDGVLYLAIENRFYPAYLGRDPHTHQPLVSFLPRFMADWLSQALNHRRYDVYTHSRWHLETMFRNSGFKDVRFYVPVTNYYFPAGFAPIEDKAAINHLLDSLDSTDAPGNRDPQWTAQVRGRYHRQKVLAWRVMLALGLQSMFAGAFVVLASPTALPGNPPQQ